MRSFPSDLSIASPAAIVLAALDAALAKKKLNAEARRGKAGRAPQCAAHEGREGSEAPAHSTPPPSAARSANAVGDDAIIFNEYPLSLDHCAREKPGTFYGLSAAGGLGWGLGAAMGAKLAAPEKFVVATVGDGAYMFANPTVCHWVADKFDIPVLTVIFNNSRYGAVRRATLSMFKDGAAGEDDGQFLADLSPSPPFEEFVRSQGGHGERVETSRPSSRPRSPARATRCAAAARPSSTCSFPTDVERTASCASTRTRIFFRRNISSG